MQNHAVRHLSSSPYCCQISVSCWLLGTSKRRAEPIEDSGMNERDITVLALLRSAEVG